MNLRGLRPHPVELVALVGPLSALRSCACTIPPHPGEIIRELCLEPLGLSLSDAAKALGVSRKTLSEILNGRAGVSPEMAIRLAIAFDTTPESWMRGAWGRRAELAELMSDSANSALRPSRRPCALRANLELKSQFA